MASCRDLGEDGVGVGAFGVSGVGGVGGCWVDLPDDGVAGERWGRVAEVEFVVPAACAG